MKVRNGYVSNSSSSSFFIMYKEKSHVRFGSKDGKFLSNFYIDELFDYINSLNNYSGDSTQIEANGFDNVFNYLTVEDQYGYRRYDAEYSDGIIKKMLDNKEQYPEAAILRVSYDDKITSKLLKAFIDSGEVISVDEEES